MQVKTFHAELAVAAVTAICGAIAVIGALELGIAWSERGPQPGFFPFYLGVFLLAASAWNAGRAVRNRAAPEEEPFLTGDQGRRVVGFFVPMLVYALVSIVLGLYVGSILYIAYVSWRHGGYHPVKAIAGGILFALLLYVVFEIAFQTPLHKGPLEEMLGIY
jgi:hypothetical protein